MLSAKQKPSGGWIKPQGCQFASFDWSHTLSDLRVLQSLLSRGDGDRGLMFTSELCLFLITWHHASLFHSLSIYFLTCETEIIPAVNETGWEHEALTVLGQYLGKNFYKHVVDSETPVVILHLSVSRGTEEVIQCQNVSLLNLQNALAALAPFYKRTLFPALQRS